MASRESWGQVEPLPSGRFRARYTHLDQRFKAPHTFPTKTAARAWLSQQRAAIVAGDWRDPNKATATKLGPYAQEWISTRLTAKGMPLAPKTQAEYRRQLNSGLKPLVDTSLEELTPKAVRAWHAERVAKAPTSAGAEARLLHAVLNTAIEDRIIDENPVDPKMLRSSTGVKHRPPSLPELSALIEEMPERLTLAVLLAAYGGARMSEWRALRRSDVTFRRYIAGGPEHPAITIERQAQWIDGAWIITSTKSEAGEREIVLPSAVAEAVRHHLKHFVQPGKGALLFQPSDPKDEFMQNHTWRIPWDKARRKLGLYRTVREHDLRAFAGTMFAQAGGTVRETMAFLGHGTVAAAMAYQATTGREAELVERMPVPRALGA